ncbi:MAG: hypothetical protein PHG71_08440 [Kiritimatiellae bacterium]|nr:hypothetical protein [Kiritimatiellia bacterium]
MESGDEIACVWRDSVGRFKHTNGALAVFERNERVFTRKVGCSDVSEISSRYT